MKRLLDNILFVLLIVAVIALFGGCIAFNKNRYHRKYPNTTTIDWLFDRNK